MKKFIMILTMVIAAVTPSLTEDDITASAAEVFQPSASISETVLMDEEGIKITAVDLTYSTSYAELSLIIENNSSTDLSFVSGSVGYSANAVNGYMTDSGYVNSDITAGNKSNETMRFDLTELEIYGISEIADIQVSFDISDDDYNHYYTGPLQVKTTAADFYDYDTDTYQISLDSDVLKNVYGYTLDYFTEDILYSQNGVEVASAALVVNKDGETAVFLEAVNTSDIIVKGSIADISVNNLTVCSSTWTTFPILPGARKVYSLSVDSLLDQSCYDALGITNIGEVSLSFTLKDSDSNELASSQEIRISSDENAVEFDHSGEEIYNADGIRIISKGLVPDDSKYNNDVHMLLLIENDSSEPVGVDDVSGSLSVNGYMTTFTAYRVDAQAGMYALMDIKIKGYSLEDNNISDISEITNTDIGLKIKDAKSSTIAEPKISIEY